MLKKRKVLFVGGVDEYGTATEMKARELNISSKELCDKNYDIHTGAYQWFNISFDCYGRTSQPNSEPLKPDFNWSHTNITCKLFDEIAENNYIVEKKENSWFCKEINSFVSDRYIISTCYHCGNKDTDSDQCSKCDNIIDSNKLTNPKYKLNKEFLLT